jgi:hypothetical protein
MGTNYNDYYHRRIKTCDTSYIKLLTYICNNHEHELFSWCWRKEIIVAFKKFHFDRTNCTIMKNQIYIEGSIKIIIQFQPHAQCQNYVHVTDVQPLILTELGSEESQLQAILQKNVYLGYPIGLFIVKKPDFIYIIPCFDEIFQNQVDTNIDSIMSFPNISMTFT